MESQEQAKITLLSEVNIQSNMLRDSLESNLAISMETVPFGHLKKTPLSKVAPENIIIFDFGTLSESEFQFYSDMCIERKLKCKEVLINCPDNIESSEILRWNNLVGIFYISDNVPCLIKGIGKIISNEMWLSRKISQDYIQHFRNYQSPTISQTHAILTKREKQIIQSLSSGASNGQIAEELFVSENTIKTHLHNIFKKINAKNRLQALLWANDNIDINEKA
ncbi:LuxR C-terminal-related transcriptional regulator [uncultured Vibrio sp.]|uniref:LuxR C-terminal-related transcriptional regulator n=1 Tax=uncultured Vibrio sp. TaxID=114054 RepID=UPI0025D47CBD|nr:LuxR C-terminal-related transcriptional regulator [uncultured Vibrio sp.]